MKQNVSFALTAIIALSLTISGYVQAGTKVDFPEKGRTITLIVPYSAGGNTDVGGRLIAAGLEKELGTPVQVANKPGGGAQIGLTAVALAKPDGYTISYMGMPTFFTSYLDPARQAVYTRASFGPIAQTMTSPNIVVVRSDSPYKTLKDFIDAAKANPEKITVASSGVMSLNQLAMMQIGQKAGVKFALVSFGGSAPGIAALLGGHVAAASAMESEVAGHVKAGTLRALALADDQPGVMLPDVPTMESFGYKVYVRNAHGMAVPAGTPKEIIEILTTAVKKVMSDKETLSKLHTLGLAPRYLDPAGLASFWESEEKLIAGIMRSGSLKLK